METLLKCANCDSEYLHQSSVEVYERDEDSPNGIYFNVTRSGVVINRKIGRGNPSDRRQGVVIRFFCENCDKDTIVTFAQHKGMTEITRKVAE